MQEALDRLKSLKSELEKISSTSWNEVDIWGNKALPTISKNYSEHLDEFKNLLKQPTYPAGVRVFSSKPEQDDYKYIFSPEKYEKDHQKWMESERRHQQQSRNEAAGYRQNCENAHRKILAFLDGIIHEAENSVAVTPAIIYVDPEKAEESTVLKIVKTMIENQGSKYDLRGSKFGGGFAAESGYQEGGQFNDYSIQVGQNLDEIAKLIQSLKTTIKTFPTEQQADIEIEIEELQTDLADEQRRDPKRLGKHVRSLWLVGCAIAVGVAGVTDFSNNVLELSKKLNVPIPIDLIQQNPHILPGG